MKTSFLELSLQFDLKVEVSFWYYPDEYVNGILFSGAYVEIDEMKIIEGSLLDYTLWVSENKIDKLIDLIITACRHPEYEY